MENKAATKVPGRKSTVTAASVFMAVESSLLAEAMVRESCATEMESWVSFWFIRLNSWDVMVLSVMVCISHGHFGLGISWIEGCRSKYC